MSSNRLNIDKENTALVVTDIQYDFLPGGALGVKRGDEILDGVTEQMNSSRYRIIVGTQDWHPEGHISFASQHEGVEPFETLEIHGHEETAWPDHCVQNTHGAELVSDLPWDRAGAIIRKGMDRQADSYSIFRNNWDAAGERPMTGLAGYLRERGIGAVVLCGLARDVCVFWSAQDATEAGFRTFFIWDLTRAVQPENDKQNRQTLESQGVEIVQAGDIAPI